MKQKLISGNHYLHAHMEGLFVNALGNAFWKDKHGKYLGANKNELDWLNLSTFDHLIGRDDREIMDLGPAHICRENDQKVLLSGNGMAFIEPPAQEKSKQRKQSCISYKVPLYNRHGKTIGTFGIGYELDSLHAEEAILKEISFLIGPAAEAIFKQNLFSLRQNKFGLSMRQLECLDLLAKGMTYKQIAANLGLSSRTIEHYIEAIKIKLNCESRHALIAKYMADC
jgi:DNA-binding CsgD family transcriptional regulator